MPAVFLITSAQCHFEKELVSGLIDICSAILGKQKSTFLVQPSFGKSLYFGEVNQGVWLELRSIGGLSPSNNKVLAQKITLYLEEALKIPSHLIYLNFVEMPPTHWAYQGSVFGSFQN